MIHFCTINIYNKVFLRFLSFIFKSKRMSKLKGQIACWIVNGSQLSTNLP